MRKTVLLIIFLVLSVLSFSQKGTVKGRVYNAKTNEPLEFATLLVQGTAIRSVSDINGNYIFTGIQPGFIHIVASLVGFGTTVSPEIQVQGNQITFLDIVVPEAPLAIKEVIVQRDINVKRIESPISVLSVGVQEIEKSAGANRDVSKVLQTLPGVGATNPNRNDLIVRGGGPSENVFYLDGIELPVINHFATQGSSGGAIGIVNPDFVREITFYTGAFPANRSNALSSVMEIRQKNGSEDRVHTKLSVGASDAALTIDGPVNDKSTFIVSARQSYLQLLFKLIGLPFLPTYNDFQFKYKYKIDQKNELYLIGIGAIDNMMLNIELEQTGTEAQKYVLSYLPIYKQWTYATGVVYKHFGDGFIDNWVFSRNMLHNNNFKYEDNDETKSKTSNYLSDEAENKVRLERLYPHLPFKLNIGAGLCYAHYTNQTSRLLFYNNVENQLNYNTLLNLFSYQLFVQVSDEYLNDRLKLSLGVNMVANNFNSNMKNPLNQISPRLSASYDLSEKWDLNANFGRYAMRPAYTTMGYKNADGEYANRNGDLKYIISDQAIMGFEYSPVKKMKLSVEGFYKKYNSYPLSVTDGISIASKGTGYGEVGDEEIISKGKGRAYGVEIMYKIMELGKLNIITTYTYFRSEFTDKNNTYRPSSWDTRHLLNLISNYKFRKNWDVAMRWRYVGGVPYSPIDMNLSTNRVAWNITNQPYIDYRNFNSLRLPDSHQLDLRVDKEIYFKKWVLNFYADVQNVYNFHSKSAPVYTNKDADGNIIEDPGGDFSRQGLRVIEPSAGSILPTVGLIIKM